MKTKKALQQPFFAGFLESQLKEDALGIQGGSTDPIADQAQTQKYPSDQEDDFKSGITKPSGGWDCEYPGPM